jgi:hypothetical protein
MRRTRSTAIAAAAITLCAVAAGGAIAAGAPGSAVSAGFANPRGITTAPGGRLLVVESASGAIDEIRNGASQTLATVPGAVDVAANGLGNTYAVIGGPPPDAPAPPAGAGLVSSLVRIAPNGKVDPIADIGAYQAAHPDPDDLDVPSDSGRSNPNGLAILPGGNILVSDAEGNDLLRVDGHGEITTVAHFKPELVPWGLPFGPPIGTPVPAEAVPTAVAVGPDGVYYVSELTGFPFAKGAARIWRIEPGSVDAVCDAAHPNAACSSVATGFSSVIDLTFSSDGTMYVLELAKNGLAGALVLGNEFPPIGALWAVKNGVRTLISDTLVAPGGVTVDGSGGLFVTTGTFGPPGGSIVQLAG